MRTRIPDINMPAPLNGLLHACETRCRAECGGLDAFDTSASRIESWVLFAKEGEASRAGSQLERIMLEVERVDRPFQITHVCHVVDSG